VRNNTEVVEDILDFFQHERIPLLAEREDAVIDLRDPCNVKRTAKDIAEGLKMCNLLFKLLESESAIL
jgi:hypothetical protein